MKQPLFPFLLAIAVMLAGCEDRRERSCRIAVRSLAAAPEDRVRGEMAKVVAFGSYALPDIEQVYHSAEQTGRVRLVEALERIGEAEALAFLNFVARWDEDPEVRKEARRVAQKLHLPRGGSKTR